VVDLLIQGPQPAGEYLGEKAETAFKRPSLLRFWWRRVAGFFCLELFDVFVDGIAVNLAVARAGNLTVGKL